MSAGFTKMELISQIITLPKEETPYKKAIHGGTNILESRDLSYGDILDFSASISPLDISANIFTVIRDTDLSKYPDPDCLILKESIAKSLAKYSINPSNISIGNGSTELIYAIASSFLYQNSDQQSKALIFHPTYGEYFTACTLFKSEISLITPEYTNPGWEWDWHLASNFIENNLLKVIFICNPNNPTGNYFEKSQILQLLKSVRHSPTVLVIDEAYIDFVDQHDTLTDLVHSNNVILLRSMTKTYGITGLRLGYCLANPNIISQIDQHLPPWSVNSLAQRAGLHLLSSNAYVDSAKEMVNRSKTYLTEQLTSLGYVVEPSQTNFILIKVNDAHHIRSQLLNKRINVRDCTSFGLPQHIRIGVKSMEDCQYFINAIQQIK